MTNANSEKPRGILNLQEGKKKFTLTRHLPSDNLLHVVEHFWGVQWNLDGRPPYIQENLPHPSVHLVIEPGNSRIHGVVSSKFTRKLEGKSWVFGIKFKPGAFYPFTKFPIATMTNKLVRLSKVFGAKGVAFDKKMVGLTGDQAKIACAEKFLYDHLPPYDENVELINHIIEQVIADRTIIKVDDIAEMFTLKERTLQRLFSRYVGVSPKWIIKRYRLHEAVEQINTGKKIDWPGLALELGYFDQAHFIKDFKMLIGKSPEEYARSVARSINPSL